MLRMLLPIIDPEEDGFIANFTYTVTEPIIILSEKLLTLLRIENSGAFDLSMIVALAIISVFRMFIQSLLL